MEQEELEWGGQRRAFLAEGIKKLRELVGAATPAQIHEVAGAVKIVGELQITSEALGVGVRSDQQGAAPEGATDQAGSGAAQGGGAG
jgi:hypothetical protein